MPLRFDLGPGEKLFVGRSVIENGRHRTQFIVHGDGPVLRERDIIIEDSNLTPISKLYYCVQKIYLEGDPALHAHEYVQSMKHVVAAGHLSQADSFAINNMMEAGESYKALRAIKNLLAKISAGNAA